MRAGRPKFTPMNLLLFFFSLGIALLAAEFALHHIGGFGATMGPKLFCEYDPVLGWRKIPGKEGWLEKKGEYRVFEKINSKGLRGPECPYKKPEGEFRILVLGDSFVEGYSISLDELFLSRLEDALNGRGDSRRYRVINAGTGAYSTDQELLFFENEGHKYEADLVLLVACYNDMWFNAQDRYTSSRDRWFKPLFRLDGDRLVLTNVPLPKSKPAPPPAQIKPRMKQWLKTNSIIYCFVTRRIKGIEWLKQAAIWMGLVQESAAPKAPGDAAGHDGRAPIPAQYEIFKDTPTPQVERAWRITEALLRELKRQVEAAGARLIVFYAPIRGGLQFEKTADAMKREYGLTDLDKPGKDLALLCNKLSLPYIDPTGRLRDEIKRTGERQYYERDGHWNARGNETVAKVLIEYIEANILADRETTRASVAGSDE